MKIDLNMCARASLVVCVALLGACGGGGGGGNEVPAEIETPPNASALLPDAATGQIPLYSSNGDLQKYVGRWDSGCTLAEKQPFNATQSFVNIYEFSVVDGTSVKGRFTQRQFRDTQCSVANDPDTVSGDVSLRYSGTEEFGSTRMGRFSGTADKVSFDYAYSLRLFLGPDATGFAAGFKHLVIGGRRQFAGMPFADGVIYTKR